jgi:hypothetical protein
VIWNKTTKKYDQGQIQGQDQVLDTSTTGNNNNKALSAGSVVSSGNIDDFTASIRAVNILRQAKSPPKPMSRITTMGAQMMEDEIKLKAEAAAADAAESLEKVNNSDDSKLNRRKEKAEREKRDKRSLAEQILTSLREYDNSQVPVSSSSNNQSNLASNKNSPSRGKYIYIYIYMYIYNMLNYTHNS